MTVSEISGQTVVVPVVTPARKEPAESSRANSFDFLRFVLATLVIVSHSPIITSEPEREPLMKLTHGRMTLGELAVDGFFIISGYLVSRSWEQSRGIGDYLRRRALRIYPGFSVASLISTFVVGYLAVRNRTDYFSFSLVWKSLLCMATLTQPHSPPGAFSGLPLHSVNGPLWTIQFEFLCYLLIIILGTTGLFRRRQLILGLSVCVWAVMARQLNHPIALSTADPHLARLISGGPYCATFFLAGACFYLYRERITYSHGAGLLATLIVVISIVSWRFTRLILPTVGAYLLLYMAFKLPVRLHTFARYGDLSYGIYLYGWPVQMLLAGNTRLVTGPLSLFLIAFPIIFLLAALSWHLIEKPFLRLKRGSVPIKPVPEGTIHDSDNRFTTELPHGQ